MKLAFLSFKMSTFSWGGFPRSPYRLAPPALICEPPTPPIKKYSNVAALEQKSQLLHFNTSKSVGHTTLKGIFRLVFFLGRGGGGFFCLLVFFNFRPKFAARRSKKKNILLNFFQNFVLCFHHNNINLL